MTKMFSLSNVENSITSDYKSFPGRHSIFITDVPLTKSEFTFTFQLKLLLTHT